MSPCKKLFACVVLTVPFLAGSDKVCSGHGKCDCGKCICGQQGNVTYTGRYCEDCLVRTLEQNDYKFVLVS